MTQARKLFALLRSAMPVALALLIIAFFGGNAVFGANGVLAWSDYHRLREHRLLELAALKKDHRELANRVRLLDPRRANPDLADELVRKQLGLAHPDEVIIPLD